MRARSATRPLLPVCVAIAALAVATHARAQQPSQAVRSNADLLAFELGIQRPPLCSLTKASVGTAVTRILGNDPASIEVVIVNVSANKCYFGWDSSVSTTKGVLLSNAGTLTEKLRDDTILPALEHWAVCAAASSNLTILRCDLTG